MLVLSFHTEPSWVRAAFEAGAHGYLAKTAVSTEIETAVREVLQGNCYVSPTVAHAVLDRPGPEPEPSGGTKPRARLPAERSPRAR